LYDPESRADVIVPKVLRLFNPFFPGTKVPGAFAA
jgi:hypothetical protein